MYRSIFGGKIIFKQLHSSASFCWVVLHGSQCTFYLGLFAHLRRLIANPSNVGNARNIVLLKMQQTYIIYNPISHYMKWVQVYVYTYQGRFSERLVHQIYFKIFTHSNNAQELFVMEIPATGYSRNRDPEHVFFAMTGQWEWSQHTADYWCHFFGVPMRHGTNPFEDYYPPDMEPAITQTPQPTIAVLATELQGLLYLCVCVQREREWESESESERERGRGRERERVES